MMNRIELYRAYRERYTEIAQDGVHSEELGELLVAKSKYYRGQQDYDHVLQEIADVMICCEQLILNMADRHLIEYDILESEVRDIKLQKLKRMKDRLGTV